MSIDHIVWLISDLDEGMALFKEKTGVEPTFGGYHTAQGTKNALIKIGTKSYFEILAPDPDSHIDAKRWMGIDLIKEPLITRWAFGTDRIQHHADILKRYNKNLGEITAGQRKTSSDEIIKWQMTLPYHEPLIDLAPFFIDWSKSPIHPTDQLPEVNLSIDQIELSSEKPDLMHDLLNQLGITNYHVAQGPERISISLNSPKGNVRFE